MADNTKMARKGGRLGPLRLGKRYKCPRELGRLHEARNVRTGAPALVMTPGPLPTRKPGQTWQVRAYAQVSPPFVALEVERAPGSGKLMELAEMLDMLSMCVGVVEHDAGLHAHLTRAPKGWLKRWTESTRRTLRSLGRPALAGVTVLALGGGVWLGSRSGPGDAVAPEWRATSGDLSVMDANAPFLADSPFQDAPAIAYPMPDKPFRNQARGPCLTERGEEELNGGCWFESAKRAPCHKDLAEYRGKCYVPVSKDRGPRPPQALQP